MARTPAGTAAATPNGPRRPDRLIRPAEYADRHAVEQIVARATHWLDHRPRAATSGDCPLLSMLGAVDRGHPLTWLLLEGTTIRSCALVIKKPMLDERWRQQPGEALWIDDLYEDRDGPDADAYGPCLVHWLVDYGAHEHVQWLAACTADEAVAGDLGDRYGLEVRRSTPTSAFLLRRRTRHLPRLADAVHAQLPPCVLRRRRS
ncbi:hypothetical protein DMH18_26715 [Streptomyces sp. WAC 06783]|uniref:hypothetical protein n=1 Tax=Streptomyces sp. WAC 06783 TaxID=2203211 RepID=UPI000F73B043|nr:hypothetical protein [Streptomyces sp. WAC 06783]RSO07029.1 hypothetical protein DMH18_26715 [Streptomyces sp. WAC 06783]